jgi:hypothetical protein
LGCLWAALRALFRNVLYIFVYALVRASEM